MKNIGVAIIVLGWLAFTFACMYFFSNWYIFLLAGLSVGAEYKSR